MHYTPVELRNGRWYKREDLYRAPSCINGTVNGSKLRACQHLIDRARSRGVTRVISAASVLSPQSAMAAVVARDKGLKCTVIVGATTPEKALRHRSIAIAAEAGAEIEAVPVAYNPYLQKAARDRADAEPNAWRLPYGITTEDKASVEDIRAFVQVGAEATGNLPPEVQTLVIPFGSGNTALGVLYGLFMSRHLPRRVVLVGIGPDRRAWLNARLALLDVPWPSGVDLLHLDLHGTGYASYGDKMPGAVDGIELHPTYEGKVLRYLDEKAPRFWTRRDGSTCLWIVGGPIA